MSWLLLKLIHVFKASLLFQQWKKVQMSQCFVCKNSLSCHLPPAWLSSHRPSQLASACYCRPFLHIDNFVNLDFNSCWHSGWCHLKCTFTFLPSYFSVGIAFSKFLVPLICQSSCFWLLHAHSSHTCTNLPKLCLINDKLLCMCACVCPHFLLTCVQHLRVAFCFPVLFFFFFAYIKMSHLVNL